MALSRLNRPRAGQPDFRFYRPDTALFATLPALQMQSGVPIASLRRLAKELAGNGLVAAEAAGRRGSAESRKFSAHQYQVEDQGDGLADTPEQLARCSRSRGR